MSKADDFVTKLLSARSAAHVAHWATKSYAEHVALNEFYDAITGLMDTFVEQYQGYYGRLMSPKVASVEVDNIQSILDMQCDWFEANRYQICEREETALQNTIDEILRLYCTTLYKLKFLN